jgi:hypothetical protein
MFMHDNIKNININIISIINILSVNFIQEVCAIIPSLNLLKYSSDAPIKINLLDINKICNSSLKK